MLALDGLVGATLCSPRHEPLTAVASLAAEPQLYVHGLHWLWHTGSVVEAHGLRSWGSQALVWAQ